MWLQPRLLRVCVDLARLVAGLRLVDARHWWFWLGLASDISFKVGFFCA